MTARLTVVHCATTTSDRPCRGWRGCAVRPAARSLGVSYPRETSTNPKAESWEAMRGAACGRSVGVGAGHPPPKAGAIGPGGLTWLPLEKWEGFSAFVGVTRG